MWSCSHPIAATSKASTAPARCQQEDASPQRPTPVLLHTARGKHRATAKPCRHHPATAGMIIYQYYQTDCYIGINRNATFHFVVTVTIKTSVFTSYLINGPGHHGYHQLLNCHCHGNGIWSATGWLTTTLAHPEDYILGFKSSSCGWSAMAHSSKAFFNVQCVWHVASSDGDITSVLGELGRQVPDVVAHSCCSSQLVFVLWIS